MTYSKFTDVIIRSPNHSGKRTSAVNRITIHHMAGNLSVEDCGRVFLNPNRFASSNYGIGSDGRIACYVDEENRAWTSSSAWNDNQAITIEVANNSVGPSWTISDKAYESLIKLCADICKRYNIIPIYNGSINATLTEHRMFANTACPGPYIHELLATGRIENDIKAQLFPSEKKITQFISLLYKNILGRGADAYGLEYWTRSVMNNQKTLLDCVKGFFFSQEYTRKQKSDTAFVKDCYKAFFNRTGSKTEIDFWVGELKSGSTREKVMNRFGVSNEFNKLLRSYGL